MWTQFTQRGADLGQHANSLLHEIEVSNSTVRYTRIAVLLHWAIAAALLYQLALGWWMLDVPKSPPGVRAGWFNWHKSIGISIAIVVLLRLSWRLAHPAPGHEGLPTWQRRAAEVSHGLLYACMLVIPLSGYIGSVLSGYPVRFFGIVLPQWLPASPVGKQLMSGVHYGAVWLFMGLILLHVAAAARHWLLRDGIAQRMGLPA